MSVSAPPRRGRPPKRSSPLGLGLLAVLLVLFLVAFFTVRGVLTRKSLEIAQSAQATVAPGTVVPVTIQAGESATEIARDLQAKGLIPSDVVFLGVMKLRGAGSNFQPGVHQIVAGSPMEEILTELEQPVKPSQIRVTFPEGRRVEEEAEIAGKAGVGAADDFLKLAEHPDPALNYDFLSDKPKSASLEGYLFPDTYFLSADSPKPADLIRRMLDDFNKRVTPDLRQKMAASNHSLFDTLIVASIVEREAKVPDERPLIAGVYWNRLKSNQGLFADPTVQYALGKASNWWPRLSSDDLKVDSPYNTYTHRGLPPGPICNPGLASIQAAANPQGDYLYFVAKNDGSGRHAFARTLAEHNANRAKYQGKNE